MIAPQKTDGPTPSRIQRTGCAGSRPIFLSKRSAVRDAAAVMHRARCARAAVAGNPSIRVPQLLTNGFLGSVMHR
jgi:hypothetical protein